MAQTKAAKVVAYLRDNDLASSAFKSVLKNDDSIMTDALAVAGIPTEDFTLTDDEFNNFLKGVKPSGELDLVTWEGYYEATNYPASVGAKAFLIIAGTEKVYFGTPQEIQDKPLKHAVNHSLTNDGKIEFTLSSAYKVSIGLTRIWDAEEHVDKSTFSGTIKGEAFSGKLATPAHHAKAATTGSANIKMTLVNRSKSATLIDVSASLKPAGNDGNGGQGGGWKWTDELTFWQIAWFWVPTLFTYLGGIHLIYEVVTRFRGTNKEKDKGSEKAKKFVNDNKRVIEDVADENCVVGDVDYTGAAEIVTEETAASLNEDIRTNQPDWATETEKGIVESRREVAKRAGDGSIRSFVSSIIEPLVKEQLKGYQCLDDYNDLEAGILRRRVSEKAQSKIDALAPASVYDPLIKDVVLESRAEYYGDSYVASEEASDGAQEAYEAAAKKTAGLESELSDINDKIEAEKNDPQTSQDQIDQDEEQRRELEKDLDDAKADEADKQTERDKAKTEEEDAKKKQEDSRKEADDNKSREEFEKEVREKFK